MLAAIVHIPLVLLRFYQYSPARLARGFSHHRELAAALTTGDAGWAGSVMRPHILAAKSALQSTDRDSG
jgi:DNA-binding FadR family transcriptional regulator